MAYLNNDVDGYSVYTSNDARTEAKKRNAIFHWCRAMGLASGIWFAMVRLSYAPEFTYEPGQIKEFFRLMRNGGLSGERRGFRIVGYAWVAEMQMRSEVHYHAYMALPNGMKLPFLDNEGYWPWGSTRVEKGLSPYYMISYTKKLGGPKSYQLQGFPEDIQKYRVWLDRKYFPEAVIAEFDKHKTPYWVVVALAKLREELGYEPQVSRGNHGMWLVTLADGRLRMLHNPWRYSMTSLPDYPER